jgi:hypothetical protein
MKAKKLFHELSSSGEAAQGGSHSFYMFLFI